MQMNELKTVAIIVGIFLIAYFIPLDSVRVQSGDSGIIQLATRIRQGARALLPDSGLLYCWGHAELHIQSICHAVPGKGRKKVDCLPCGGSFRRSARRLFVHHPSTFYGDIQAWARDLALQPLSCIPALQSTSLPSSSPHGYSDGAWDLPERSALFSLRSS